MRGMTREPVEAPSLEDAAVLEDRVGLCARCRHARRTANARGSAFWQCSLAQSDPRFARYPRLPVRACPGHETAHGPVRETAP
jgi:hypothetical protein